MTQRAQSDLHVGIVGYGMRASLARELHRPGAGSRVSAVCDPRPDRRAAARRDYPDAIVTETIEELLSLDLEAAMIFTPDALHAVYTIAALEAGMAVFCEKPMAISIEDCDAMLESAHRTGSRLYVGHNMRHMPVMTLMRQIIQDGTIGEVKAVWCRHFVGNGGDYYFKDWHADRTKSLGLLLQKGAHDIDAIHWLAGGYSSWVQGMGALSVYGQITDRRDRSDEVMADWFSTENWPPTEQTGLNPVIDVEDITQVNMQLDNGVLASYQQCHFTPDYWRNYTVIGTRGRLENFGDSPGSEVGAWTQRISGSGRPDRSWVIPAGEGGHEGADSLMIAEFLRFVTNREAPVSSPVAARNAVAAGVVATLSVRADGRSLAIPPISPKLEAYFSAHQVT